MSDEIDRLLINDVLAAKKEVTLRGVTVDLKKRYPNKLRLSDKDGEIFDYHSYARDDADLALVEIEPSSRWIEVLDPQPIRRRQKFAIALRDQYELIPKEDFDILSIYHKTQTDLAVGSPEKFLLVIDDARFHKMAVKMLELLANPTTGANLLDVDKQSYMHAYANPASEVSMLLDRIVANASLKPAEVNSLKTTAIAKNNFEFVRRLESAFGMVQSAGYVERLEHGRPSTEERSV
jgi:hypothetical protein